MNFSSLIKSFLMGKVGQKYAGSIGKKFGLSGQQVMTVAMVGIPILMKYLASRKAKKAAAARVIKGR